MMLGLLWWKNYKQGENLITCVCSHFFRAGGAFSYRWMHPVSVHQKHEYLADLLPSPELLVKKLVEKMSSKSLSWELQQWKQSRSSAAAVCPAKWCGVGWPTLDPRWDLWATESWDPSLAPYPPFDKRALYLRLACVPTKGARTGLRGRDLKAVAMHEMSRVKERGQ